MKELEERGTPLSELLADQLDADPIGTLTKLKPYSPVKCGCGGCIKARQMRTDETDVALAREAKITQFYAHVSR